MRNVNLNIIEPPCLRRPTVASQPPSRVTPHPAALYGCPVGPFEPAPGACVIEQRLHEARTGARPQHWGYSVDFPALLQS